MIKLCEDSENEQNMPWGDSVNFLEPAIAQSSGQSYSDGGEAQGENCSKPPEDPSLL